LLLQQCAAVWGNRAIEKQTNRSESKPTSVTNPMVGFLFSGALHEQL
jgi:hypothetical protein